MKSASAFVVLLFAGAAASVATAQSGGFYDLASIDRTVSAFTGAGIGQPGGASLPVDRRMRLAPCFGALVTTWYGTRQDNVLVQCPDPGGWRLFVAVSGNGRQDAASALPPAVARGEALTIAVEGDGFTVSQAGEAMEAGPVGAWIRVRTGGKATPIRARIARPGLVIVPVD